MDSEVRRLVAASWADFAARIKDIYEENDPADTIYRRVAQEALETAHAVDVCEIDMGWDER